MAYVGFNKLKAKIAAKGGVSDPGAVAAAIGRKKYGKAKFQKAAAEGKSMKGVSHLPEGVDLTPTGDIGAHRGAEAYEQRTFSGCQTMTAQKAGWVSNKIRKDSNPDFKGKGA